MQVHRLDAYLANVGAITTMCTFQGQRFRCSLHEPLSSLLKTIKINGSNECTWCLMPHQRQKWRQCKQDPRMLGRATHWSVDLVYDINWRHYAEDKLSRNIFDPHSDLETPKDIPTKSRHPRHPASRTELYHHTNFHADRPKISVPSKKYIFFFIGDSLERLPSHAIHFFKVLVVLMLRPSRHVMLRLTVFEIYNLLREKTCLEPISTIMQNFTPIGCTSTETSIPHTINTHNHLKLNIRRNAY